MPNLDLQPTLRGELVVLRPTRPEDWEGMFAAAADPLVWEIHPVSDRWREPIFREFFDGALASRAALTILEAKTGQIIGSSRYHGYDPDADEIEIGWTFLARAYWGGDTNREVKRLMLAHIFRFVPTVIFMVGEKNFRSQRAMEKIGGRLRNETRDRAYHGVRVRDLVYEISRDQPARP
jgi:RimJ/RimL family protein N-acetyltransferase